MSISVALMLASMRKTLNNMVIFRRYWIRFMLAPCFSWSGWLLAKPDAPVVYRQFSAGLDVTFVIYR
jgi:hypothetical protein